MFEQMNMSSRSTLAQVDDVVDIYAQVLDAVDGGDARVDAVVGAKTLPAVRGNRFVQLFVP